MLAYQLPTEIIFEGKTYSVNVSFDRVLRMFEVVEDTSFSEEERMYIALELMLSKRSYKRVIRVHQAVQLNALLQKIVTEFVEGPKRPKLGPSTPVMDFKQDWEFIYASFMQAYHMDLYNYHGKLDWRLFQALMQGLPKDTKLKEVMTIRSEKIPERTKYNGEQIQAMQEAKTYYALQFSEEKQEQLFQESVNTLAENLIRRAGGVPPG